ncbi:MAG TPA: hypothetical protein VI685_04835 [Candidatus Angelobacter sp.]
MKHKTSATAICLGLFLCIQTGVAVGQGRITKAELGTGITDKYEIVNPTSQFTLETAKIYCAWKAEGLKSGTSVRGVWIAEDVGKVAPANYKIDEATFNPSIGSPNEGSFTLSKPNNGFPVGKYRLEIYLGKDLAKTVPFTVKAK